ncbi:hypothetical protein GCM10023201_52010 [Actinomycetospora corticicola]|uniref:ABC-type transporter Mla MlaB component n=1 Tax=Actinomycetospora corticicola TaxID=663602 RepID=A0A7Y9DY49_9PSEU|nr:hypothetical protein [Actinomycetospora corticicola]NYD37535.1 ABC-type transporter Mla MlaB component [Actinomycetospora corticicola]
MTPTPRRLVLAGGLDIREMSNLTEYRGRLHSTGVRALELDLSAVTSCDRHGLEGLLALAERGDGLVVVVTGARWRHFIGMLGAADVREVRRLHAAARTLVDRRAASE